MLLFVCGIIEYTGALNAKKAKEKLKAKRVIAANRIYKNLIFHSNILYRNINKSQLKI